FIRVISTCALHFRSPPISRHFQCPSACLKSADIVAKVENRTTSKISQKLIFSRRGHCNTPYRRYEAPWSFWCETMWSLISPRAKRISGPEKMSIVTPKSLLQQYRRKAAIRRDQHVAE